MYGRHLAQAAFTMRHCNTSCASSHTAQILFAFDPFSCLPLLQTYTPSSPPTRGMHQPPNHRPPPLPPPPPACRHHQVENAIDDTADATKGAYRGAKGAAKDAKADAAAAGERVKDEGHGALSSLKHHTVGHSDRTPPLRAV